MEPNDAARLLVQSLENHNAVLKAHNDSLLNHNQWIRDLLKRVQFLEEMLLKTEEPK